jgi:hypothetical protein
MIRLIVAIFLAVLGMTAPGHAINWQGHDDWLEFSPHALELKRELKDASPAPPEAPAQPQCQERKDVGKVAENPYEPVPLLCDEKRRN